MADVDHRKRIDRFESFSAVYLLLIFLLSLLVAVVGNHPLFFVIIGFLATMITVIISLVIHEEFANRKKTLWIIPLMTISLFYLFGTASVNLLEQFDMEVLTALNFVLSMIYVLLAFGILSKPSTVRSARVLTPVKQPVPAKKISAAEPKSIEEYVNSIEDKSKAINFAIGRIYSKYHGGSKEMRQKLRIPPEWYNEFSSIGVKSDVVDYTELSEMLKNFERHFEIFEKTERQVFGSDVSRLRDLIRDPKGDDRIIDVIEYNDKDPVKAYYEGAKDFCKRLRAEIGKRELSLVKNEYKGPDDEDDEKTKSSSLKHGPSKKVDVKDPKGKRDRSSFYDHP
ncbi:MAG: hypothetical protein ACOCU6_02640 [Nanoarchaeota archaeon]